MTISAAMGISFGGMQIQSQRLDTAAHNIANIATPGYETDPALDITDILTAKRGFEANAALFEAGADIWDMLMTIKRD